MRPVCSVRGAMASSESASHLRRAVRRIHAVVRKIPRGRVATYGQVAELAGHPGRRARRRRGAEDEQAAPIGCRGSA